MFLPFKYFYLVLNIPFLLVWLALFVWNKSTRKEQLLMSVLLMPAGPISEILYFQDYWLPQSVVPVSVFGHLFMIEDLLFVFSIGGIGGVIYEALMKRYASEIKTEIHYSITFPLIAAIAVIIGYSLFYLGMNSIFATSFAFLAGTALIVSQRRDLLANSLISGLAVMAIMFLSYILGRIIFVNAEEILKQTWFLYGSGLGKKILGIPLTEMVWGFSWGALAGPLYEFIKRFKNKRI